MASSLESLNDYDSKRIDELYYSERNGFLWLNIKFNFKLMKYKHKKVRITYTKPDFFYFLRKSFFFYKKLKNKFEIILNIKSYRLL